MTTTDRPRPLFYFFLPLLLVITLFAGVEPAYAGARIEINDEAHIDFGFVGQFVTVLTQRDNNGDGTLDFDKEFRVRRGRIALRGQALKWLKLVFQTEMGSPEGGIGYDLRVLDAFVHFKPLKAAQVRFGFYPAALSRQNTTAIVRTMNFDRSPINARSLAWGSRANSRLGTSGHSASDSGFRTPTGNRDLGVTFFGDIDLSEEAHFKYYLGVLEGIHTADSIIPHLTGRVQLNLFDAEEGYMLSGNHLGKKSTIAIGGGGEYQKDLARADNGLTIDYVSWTADIFVDWALPHGAVTFEGGYIGNAYLNAVNVDLDGDLSTPGTDLRHSEGHGVYGMLGYLIGRWQPWVSHHQWFANIVSGEFSATQAGVSYFLVEHHVNFRLAYEYFSPELTESFHSGVLAVHLLY